MYKYIAYDAKKRKKSGVIIADDMDDALHKLREKGLVPVRLNNADTKPGESDSIWEKDFHIKSIYKIQIKKAKLAVLLKQLSIMLKAGVSVIFAIQVIIDGEKDKTIKQIFTEIENDLQTGISLSQAMSKFKAFSDVLISVIEAGELNGRLDEAFELVSTMIEKENAMAGKVKSAMMYPAFLSVLTIAVVIIINTVVLPAFIGMYEQFDSELPVVTRLMMSISDFLINYWPYLIAFIAALIVAYRLLLKKSVLFSIGKDRLLLKIPVVGALMKKSFMARFTRIMSSLVSAGVNIISALESAQKVIASEYVRFFIARTISHIRLGSPINEAMKRYSFFDPLLISMIRVGEETGMLNEALENIANLYENQTDEATKRFTSVIEPVMTVIMALVIGFVIVSAIMPMFNMYSIVGG